MYNFNNGDDETQTGVGPPSAPTGYNATWEDSRQTPEYPRRDDATHLNPSLGGGRLMARKENDLKAAQNFVVGCWNVTTLNNDLAAEHLMQSLKNYNYDIIALSETHNIGMEDACGGQLIMSGGTTHYAGVGILMSKRAKSNLISTYYISDRVLAARFTLKRGHLFFIAVYAPTSTAPDDVIGQFYD